MINSIQEFEREWGHESAATRKLMDELTDASLAQAVARDHRTLGRIAWHVTTTIGEMMQGTGLAIGGPAAGAPVPATAKAIAAGYAEAAASLLEAVKREWTDATLKVEDNMYGETWTRGFTLECLINHEVHHRGQMTVLMRQAGLRVPGVYGPAREEWAAMGAPVPEI